MLSSIVLAGGASRRFGGDKPLATVDGVPLIRRVSMCLSKVSGEVYLSVDTAERGRALLKEVEGIVAGFIADEPGLPCKGPMRGICTTLRAIAVDELLIVPSDIPWVKPDALMAFVERSRANRAAAASPLWGNGMVETLVQYVRVDSGKAVALRACALRAGLARPSDMLRGSSPAALIHVKHIAKDPMTFANVNRPEDIRNPVPRGPMEGYIASDVVLGGGACGAPSSLFWRAAEAMRDGRWGEASELYEKEGKGYSSLGIHHLASHAFSDALYCASKARLDASAFRG